MVAGAEALARLMWDPGGPDNNSIFRDKSRSPVTSQLLRILHENVPRSKNKSIVVREAIVTSND